MCVKCFNTKNFSINRCSQISVLNLTHQFGDDDYETMLLRLFAADWDNNIGRSQYIVSTFHLTYLLSAKMVIHSPKNKQHSNYIKPLVDQGLLIIEDSRSHSALHITLARTPLDKCSAWRRDLYPTTITTRDRHPCHRRYSNPKSHQVRGRRLTHQTARELGIG